MSAKKTFFCPHCGQDIPIQAYQCQYCSQHVTFRVRFAQSIDKGRRSEMAKYLHQFFSDSLFPSFGAARKYLEKGAHQWIEDVNEAQRQKLEKLIDHYDGYLQVETARTPNNPKQQRSTIIAMVSIALVLGLGYGYYQKFHLPKQQLNKQASTDQDFDDDMQEIQTIPDQIASERRQTKPETRDIKELLHSTATVIGGRSTGSAFFVTNDGYLVTNHHVTEKMSRITVQTYDQVRHSAKLIRFDPDRDLALLKIASKNYQPFVLGDATQMQPGEQVITIGAPHGLSFTVTQGIISFVGRKINGHAYIQADVAINPGNSGGPMINAYGEVIGINNFILRQTEGLNFAIPANYLYMGDDAFLHGIVPTQGSNLAMRKWHEPDQGASQVTFNDSSSATADSKNHDVNRMQELAGSIKTLSTQLQTMTQDIQAYQSSMQDKIRSMVQAMRAPGLSITEHSKQEAKMLQTEKTYYRGMVEQNKKRVSKAKLLKSKMEQLILEQRKYGQNTSALEKQKSDIESLITQYNKTIKDAQSKL